MTSRKHEGSPCSHLSADVQVIVLWLQIQLHDRCGLHFQPAVLFVFSVPLGSPFQQLQVKLLFSLPLATEERVNLTSWPIEEPHSALRPGVLGRWTFEILGNYWSRTCASTSILWPLSLCWL